MQNNCKNKRELIRLNLTKDWVHWNKSWRNLLFSSACPSFCLFSSGTRDTVRETASSCRSPSVACMHILLLRRLATYGHLCLIPIVEPIQRGRDLDQRTQIVQTYTWWEHIQDILKSLNPKESNCMGRVEDHVDAFVECLGFQQFRPF